MVGARLSAQGLVRETGIVIWGSYVSGASLSSLANRGLARGPPQASRAIVHRQRHPEPQPSVLVLGTAFLRQREAFSWFREPFLFMLGKSIVLGRLVL